MAKIKFIWSGGTDSGTAFLVGLIQSPHDRVGMEGSKVAAVGFAGSVGVEDSAVDVEVMTWDPIVEYGGPAQIE